MLTGSPATYCFRFCCKIAADEMGNLLTRGKSFISWGMVLIFFGAICIFANVGTIVAILGASSLVLGLLLAISGSIISTTAASPRKAALYGGIATVVGATALGVMLLFPNTNRQSHAMPPILIVLVLTVHSLLTSLVALTRLRLDRRTGRGG
jgi:hypothetical protein